MPNVVGRTAIDMAKGRERWSGFGYEFVFDCQSHVKYVCVCVYICWWLSVFVSCLAVVPPPPQPLSPSPPDELSFPWLYAIWITQVSWHFCASVLWSFSSLLSCSCVSVGICVQEGKSVRYNIIIKWIAKVCPYQTCVVHQGMQTRDGKYSFWEEEILILEFR